MTPNSEYFIHTLEVYGSGKEYALRIVTDYVRKRQLESVLKLQDNPWFSDALPKEMKWYSRTAQSLSDLDKLSYFSNLNMDMHKMKLLKKVKVSKVFVKSDFKEYLNGLFETEIPEHFL